MTAEPLRLLRQMDGRPLRSTEALNTRLLQFLRHGLGGPAQSLRLCGA